MLDLTIPGISVPGKLLLAKISEELAILMLGVIGHEAPIFSITDMQKTANQIDALSPISADNGPQRTQSFIIHFGDFAAGTWLGTGPGLLQECQPSIHFRISFHNQAAFWAFSFLITQMASQSVAHALSVPEQQNIVRILDFFKNDHGAESAMGEPVMAPDRTAPPEYAAMVAD
ncbi:hypothetical protein C8R46DRAFT_1035896 [Mycena filopes]|nr:hypothetical protein C8R46DRAFT_1035896 [Mycena filopes]